MSLRIIILILAFLSFLTTATGGYLYYSSIKAFSFQEEQTHARMRLESSINHIESSFAFQKKAVKAMAGLNIVQAVLASNIDTEMQDRANSTLVLFNDALEADVCYLMDRDGNTIASSNYDTQNSFVGKNYQFRPYFQQAIKGAPAIYMALGITSDKRGVYYSAPVYSSEGMDPIGVAVIKSSVEFIEEEFMLLPDDNTVLIDPHGIVFAANQPGWLFRPLWEIAPETRRQIVASRQFGSKLEDWLGYAKKGQQYAVDTTCGKTYMIYQHGIVNCPDWQVVILNDLQTFTEKAAAPLVRTVGHIVLTVSVLTGVAVLFLYRTAHQDIIRRRKAEQELQEARNELETKVQERTADLETANIKLQQEIVERLRVEKALEDARDSLEQRVRERTILFMKTYNQLLHADKLGTIGKLSASIAHEFGNPIFGIRNLLEGLKSRATLEEMDRNMVDIAIKECNRVKDLLHNLKDFNRPTDDILAPVDIHEAIDNTLQLCSKDFKNKNIIVRKHYGRGVSKVMAIRDQIKQIILNLLNNAAEAMPKQGGIVEIKTESLGSRIGLYISDSGMGIKPEHIDHIFDPFFSTKPDSEGSGLGLSVVYGILTRLEGEIDVASEPGRGAMFTITLPAA